MGVAVIADLDLSAKNLGRINFIEEVELEAMYITKGQATDNVIPFYASLIPANTYQRGLKWSVLGSNKVQMNESTGELIVFPAAINESIVVKVESTSNPNIMATMETRVSFEDRIIFFESADVKDALLSSFDTNGDGEISASEASMKALGLELKNFATATTFNEFKEFKGTTELVQGAFAGSKFTEITLPETLVKLGSSSIESMNNLQKLIIPEGVTTIGSVAIRANKSLALVDFPSSVNKVMYSGIEIVADKAIIVIRTTAVTGFNNPVSVPANGKVYVPDSVIDQYKAAWTAIASQIYPLSEYVA